MRIRLYIILAIIGVVFGVIRMFPLSWVMGWISPNVDQNNYTAQGTIWKGYIQPTIDPDVIVETHLNPRGVLNGAMLKLRSYSGPIKFSAQSDGTTFKNITVQVPVNYISKKDFRFKALPGFFTVNLDTLVLAKDRASCRSASGQLETDALSGFNFDGLALNLPLLKGPIVCENGDLVLNVTSSTDMDDLTAKVTFGFSGDYFADISIDSKRPEAAPILALYGFQQNGQAYQLTEKGKWR